MNAGLLLVRRHTRNVIFALRHVSSRAQAVVLAYEAGLVSPGPRTGS